jgi:hypothetical protein
VFAIPTAPAPAWSFNPRVAGSLLFRAARGVRLLLGTLRRGAAATLERACEQDGAFDMDIDIYVENRWSFREAREYTLKLLLPFLTEAGVHFRILDRAEPPPRDPADAAFLHIDLTDVPRAFTGLHTRYDRVINGHALTIRRTLYSTARVARDTTWQGPVIAKTVLNSGGYPELHYRKNRSLQSRLLHEWRRLSTPHYKAQICPPYAVYDAPDRVPDSVWRDERMIVERFLPGNLNLPVEKCRYSFMFDTELNLRSTYDDLLCHPAKVLSTELIADVPEPVRRVRRERRLDYGAIDYFMVDGAAIVVDANKTVCTTPAWVTQYESVADYIDRLAATLIAFARGDRAIGTAAST